MCTYLPDWTVNNKRKVGVHKRNTVHSRLSQRFPSYFKIELHYKNASAIISIDNILTNSLGDTLFLSEEAANKLDIINEGIVPCKVIIQWTVLVNQYSARYLYIIPIIGLSFGFMWIFNLC